MKGQIDVIFTQIKSAPADLLINNDVIDQLAELQILKNNAYRRLDILYSAGTGSIERWERVNYSRHLSHMSHSHHTACYWLSKGRRVISGDDGQHRSLDGARMHLL